MTKRVGRPRLPLSIRRKGIFIKLPPALVAWLASKGNQSRLIENALVKQYKIKL